VAPSLQRSGANAYNRHYSLTGHYRGRRGNIIERTQWLELLQQVQRGELAPQEALERLAMLPYEDLGLAKLDHHRALRRGFPEVIFGQGKTPEQVAELAQQLVLRGQRLLITRVTEAHYDQVRARLPDSAYHPLCGAITLDRSGDEPRQPGVLVLSAGTADVPVAEEAAVTAEIMGCQVDRVYDVGVAGLHRLLSHLPQLRAARGVIVAAGMEGALPSVVAGLVAVPVIAVPTSVGYGASFGGLAALLAMLNTCAGGVAVVNIDNGFGAGYLAALINRLGGEA
jgi:NCAIR mutase (PurE)-related protein